MYFNVSQCTFKHTFKRIFTATSEDILNGNTDSSERRVGR